MNYRILKQAIKDSKIQRKDLALKANITPKTVDNIVAGGDPKVSTLEAIANVIGIRMSVLFDEEITYKTELRQAGRDYVEKGKIEHKYEQTSDNGTDRTTVSDCSSTTEADLRAQIAQLKSQLEDKDQIITLLKSKL